MQSFKNKIVSLTNKAVGIIGVGTDPYFEGKHYFDNYDNDVEELALNRFKNHCDGCEHNEEEPIDFLKVADKIIPKISERMCGNCGGCTLSYKLRQSITKCKKWSE